MSLWTRPLLFLALPLCTSLVWRSDAKKERDVSPNICFQFPKCLAARGRAGRTRPECEGARDGTEAEQSECCADRTASVSFCPAQMFAPSLICCNCAAEMSNLLMSKSWQVSSILYVFCLLFAFNSHADSRVCCLDVIGIPSTPPDCRDVSVVRHHLLLVTGNPAHGDPPANSDVMTSIRDATPQHNYVYSQAIISPAFRSLSTQEYSWLDCGGH